MKNSITPLNFPTKNCNSLFKDMKGWHVAIRTTKYEELIKWYEQNLDFRLIKEFTSGEMKLALIAPPGDNSFLIEVLGVKENEDFKQQEVKSGFDHLCFNVDDLDKTMQALKHRNISIEMTFPAPAIGKRVAFIIDPFGNKLEFSEELKS